MIESFEIWIPFGILRNISHDKWKISCWCLKVERLSSTCNVGVTQRFIWTHNGVKETYLSSCGFFLPFHAVFNHLTFLLHSSRNTKHQQLFSNGEYFNLRRWRIAFRFFNRTVVLELNDSTPVRRYDCQTVRIRLTTARSFGTDFSSFIRINYELAGSWSVVEIV